MYLRTALAIAAVGALSACINPEDFESAPVIADTPMGPVTCQLYTTGQTAWDRAIDMPVGMSIKTGDTYCRNEGVRILEGGEPVYAPTAGNPA
ncbi:hypothetical protein SAMN05421538_101338 [Paracoccus isoporae]|uniref:Lipoprotein n=1 Tax=Paracoccus isoporae TaxID=591205 RepID=A0A1G6TRI1_9RHOB|nr:hypothetical protein [Paracoccus isoporae]SDD31086.1 hypothetical protein SAMN05421538_101338 [Paracoccus isoporae]